MTTRFSWLKAVLVLGLAGCSAGPSAPGSTAQPSLDLSEHTASIAGQWLYGPDSQRFSGCELNTQPSSTVIVTPPSFVVRLKDTRNSYYANLGLVTLDGYSLPFPTPWIRPTDTSSCVDPQHCATDPGPYYYEHDLVTYVTGMVSHQFKVYEVDTYKGDQYQLGSTLFFYNGTPQSDQLANMQSVVSEPRWTDPNHTPYYSDVEPGALGCIYVLEYDSATNKLVYTGYHAQVAQKHDPINWPN